MLAAHKSDGHDGLQETSNYCCLPGRAGHSPHGLGFAHRGQSRPGDPARNRGSRDDRRDAPFVGLFGTVWGITDSFIGISKTNTTNLAVVAPGIAEALLATAMGLIAAIPAVVMYNAFARAITGYRVLLGDAAAEVLRHLSRDLDREVFPLKEEAPIVPLRQSAE